MKKLGLVTILSLGLAFSPLCAIESQKNVAQGITQKLSVADSAFLFSTSANTLNVETLSEEEMGVAIGEFWPILIGLGVSFLSYLNAPAPKTPFIVVSLHFNKNR